MGISDTLAELGPEISSRLNWPGFVARYPELNARIAVVVTKMGVLQKELDTCPESDTSWGQINQAEHVRDGLRSAVTCIVKELNGYIQSGIYGDEFDEAEEIVRDLIGLLPELTPDLSQSGTAR